MPSLPLSDGTRTGTRARRSRRRQRHAGRLTRMQATVAAIYRYPVKAMAGESLTAAELRWHGLEGDRRYAFVQSDHTGDFPWLTIRELPGMMLYRPRAAADPEDP